MAELLQDGGVWIVTALLLGIGLAGCVVPILPGHLVIFAAAVGYRLMVGG